MTEFAVQAAAITCTQRGPELPRRGELAGVQALGHFVDDDAGKGGRLGWDNPLVSPIDCMNVLKLSTEVK